MASDVDTHHVIAVGCQSSARAALVSPRRAFLPRPAKAVTASLESTRQVTVSSATVVASCCPRRASLLAEELPGSEALAHWTCAVRVFADIRTWPETMR